MFNLCSNVKLLKIFKWMCIILVVRSFLFFLPSILICVFMFLFVSYQYVRSHTLYRSTCAAYQHTQETQPRLVH